MSGEHAPRRSVNVLGPFWKAVGSGLVVCALFVGGFWGAHALSPGGEAEEDAVVERASSVATPVVTLTAEQRSSAKIGVSQPSCRYVQKSITVPGTIVYDTTRYVVLKAPVDCVVTRFMAAPGQVTSPAEALAELSSSEIALARAQVRNNEADCKLAQINFERARRSSACCAASPVRST